MTTKALTEKKYDESARLNQSILGILDESVPTFKKIIDGESEDEEDTSKQYKGKIIHKLLFESETFSIDFKVIDEQPPSHHQKKGFCNELIYTGTDYDEQDIIDAYKNNYSTKSKKDEKVRSEALELESQYRNYIVQILEGSDKEIISQELYDECQEAVKALLDHPILGPLLRQENEKNGFTAREIPIAWDINGEGVGSIDNMLIGNHQKSQDQSKPVKEREPKLGITKHIIDDQNIIPCKSKIDKLDVSFSAKLIKITDAKSIGMGFKSFTNYFEDNNLHLQAAMYADAAIKYIHHVYQIPQEELTQYHFDVKFAAVNLNNMEARSFKVSEAMYRKGCQKLVQLLDDYIWHTQEDKWECKKSEYMEGGVII